MNAKNLKIRQLFPALKNFFKKIKFCIASKKKDREILNRQELDMKLVQNLKKSRFPKIKQLKYYQNVFNKKELWAFRTLLAIILATSLWLGYDLYSKNSETVPDEGGEYIEAFIGKINAINPILASQGSADMAVVKLLFSGLMKYDENLELVPDLAESYEISEDQKSYIFKLKEGIRWHDWSTSRETVDASDVVYTIETIQNPKFKSPFLQSFKGISIEKIGEMSVKFNLSEPFTPFLSVLTIGILPEHRWFDVPADTAPLAELNWRPVGCGPYLFNKFKRDSSGRIEFYSIKRNEDFYGEKPLIKNITFKYFLTYNEAIESLRSNKALAINLVPKDYLPLVNSQKNLQLYSFSLPQYSAVFFNQNKNENLKQLNLRRALAMAIDKERLVNEVLEGTAEAIHGPILPGMVGYNPDIEKIEYNPSEASKLLDELGWVMEEGENYRVSKDSKKSDAKEENGEGSARDELTITLSCIDITEIINIAKNIKDKWEKIGVKTIVKTFPEQRFIAEVIRTREYEALLTGEILKSDPDLFPFWHSSQASDPGLNLAMFSNKEADVALEDARRITDPQKRHDTYIHFQNILVAQQPAIFIFTPKYIFAADERVKGIPINQIYSHEDRFIGIEKWHLKTKSVLKSDKE